MMVSRIEADSNSLSLLSRRLSVVAVESSPPCHAFGRYFVQPFRFAIAMIRDLSVEAPTFLSPARPIECTAALISPGVLMGNDFPLPAKSLGSIFSRSPFEMNRSHSGSGPLV